MINKEQVEGKAQKFLGAVKTEWAKLTDDEAAYASGQKDKLFGAVKEKYGIDKEAFEKKYSELESSCGCSSTSKTDKAA